MSNNHTVVHRSRWQRLILLIYPFLLAYYPVFALRNHNIIYVDLATILRTLLLVTAATLVISAIIYLITRDLEKSSVIVSLIILFFLTYGHLYIQLEDIFGKPPRHLYLAGAGTLISLVITIIILRNRQAARVISQFLAVVSIVLLILALFESLRYDIGEYRATVAAAKKISPNISSQVNENLPDVYLIILDAHTRSDVLKSRYAYDNTDFVRELKEMGFYVASCSQSNYASTKLALFASMYGDYIQNIIGEGEILPPLKSSALNQTLKALGYKTIAFENRARGHFDLKEDIRFSRNQMAFGKFDLRGGISEFEKMVIDTSFLHFLVDTELIPGFDDNTLLEWEFWEHYYQTQYILSELENIPEIPGPKFIFAHLMVPHSPFIFNPDGSYQRRVNTIDGYRANVQFIDNRIPTTLRNILAKSETPPIIMLMGDHGPSTRKTITRQMRMAILSAYLVNKTANERLYPSITPVNALRIILNSYYGGRYPLLEDLSYYAYNTSEIPEAEVIANNCQPAP